MSLIKCPECNKEVSDSAFKCPHCGKLIKKPKRGIMGKIFLWIFYGFNILMLWWMIAGTSGAAKHIETATSEAERAGAAIGTGLGVIMIIFLWALGDIITGFLAFMTRPKVR